MKELVVLSGKGGTGKTSLVASLAALARPLVLADCDVDAADLHLVLGPRIESREDFSGGSKARIMPGHCTACGKCEELCRFDAIYYTSQKKGSGIIGAKHAEGRSGKWWLTPFPDPEGPFRQTAPVPVFRDGVFRVDPLACEGCGVCYDYCAEGAIEFAPVVAGQWFTSETRCGPMVHARLGVGAENSGKLVTLLRRAAGRLAHERKVDLVLCDGSPGIGCPVIASLTGASLAVFVVEPTASGLHDFERVAQLARRLAVPGVVVVNKADLNPDMTARLLEAADTHGIESLGNVPYDPEVTRAQIAGLSVVESSSGAAAEAIRGIWPRLQRSLRDAAPSSNTVGQSAGVRLEWEH